MKKSLAHSRGITIMGFLVVLIVGAFFLLMGAKLWPAYNEFFGVKTSMEQMKNEAGGPNRTINQIWNSLELKFNIHYVETPTRACLKLDRRKGEVSCTYDRIIPFVYNIDFVVHFTHTVKL